MNEENYNSPLDEMQHFPDGSGDFIDHPSQARPGIHVFPDKLYVVTCVENPLRWRSRYLNYWDFHKHVTDSGGILYTVELALGNRKFEVTHPHNPRNIQIRSRDEMFRKENLQNLGAERLPLDAKYVAFIDADMIFTRPDWVQETLHQLQHFDIVQMFSSYSDLGPHHEVVRDKIPSVVWSYYNGETKLLPNPDVVQYYAGSHNYIPGATGLAWAYRIEALDKLGRLMDRAILGSADWYMAYALLQRDDFRLQRETERVTPHYRDYLMAWIRNAVRIQANVGFVEGHVIHKWHGPKGKRGYSTRWKILEDNKFDPYVDLLTTHQGTYDWAGNKPKLRDEVRHYLRSRDEDSVNL